MNAKEQLRRLVRMQEIAIQCREAQAVVDDAPRHIEEIENRFRERNAEYVTVRDRYNELEADQRKRNADLATLEDSRKKYMDDLMQVTNQREYAAMLKEIDNVKAEISGHEDAVLQDMEELEALKSDLDERSAHIEGEREVVGKERAVVEDTVRDAEATVRGLTAERERLASELPAGVVATVSRVEGMRQGIFLARAEDGVCQACYVRIRPQVFQEIKLATKVHHCASCRRFLFHEASLGGEAKQATSSNPEASELGAMNGGTV